MKLALVSPLPPLPSPLAGLAVNLAAALAAQADVTLFVEAPPQIDPEDIPDLPLKRAADLPELLASGKIDVPVYLLSDDLHCGFMVRYLRENPGILVDATGGEVSALLAALPQEPELSIASFSKHNQARIEVHDPTDTNEAARLATRILSTAAQPKDGTPWRQAIHPQVEVCLVSYNSKKIIRPCLEALAAQDYPNLTVTVFDNASSDGTAEFVGEQFPAINTIASTTNLGFAGGNNRVIEETGAKYVALINQDAIPQPNCIRELVNVAEMASDIAAVGAKMLMQRCPTIINSAGIRMNQGGFGVDGRVGEKDDNPDPGPQQVFGACGGAILLRADRFRELGGFDEKFFMYFEDLDLAWRTNIAGYRVMYAPLAVVYHDWHGDLDQEEDVQAEADADDEKTRRRRFLCERNRLQCVIKNYERQTLRSILPQMRAYDRTRTGWMNAVLDRGDGTGYHRMVIESMRNSWAWCRKHRLSLWWRRRKTQKLRRKPDSEITLIEEGIGEPSYIGQLEIIQDRHSARPTDRIEMGTADDRSLGSGWYAPEPLPEQGNILTRWMKPKAWFYLRPDKPVSTLHIKLAGSGHANTVRVFLKGQEIGSVELTTDQVHEVTLSLPEPLPADRLQEFALVSQHSFVPKKLGHGEDERILALRVAAIRLG